MTCAGLKGRCYLKLKSILLEIGYIEKWPKFAYLESKVPHLKIRVKRDRVYFPIGFKCKYYGYRYTGWGSGLGLTQNSWFNTCHGLFSPLTPIINTNTLSLKCLMNTLPTFHWNMHFNMF